MAGTAESDIWGHVCVKETPFHYVQQQVEKCDIVSALRWADLIRFWNIKTFVLLYAQIMSKVHFIEKGWPQPVNRISYHKKFEKIVCDFLLEISPVKDTYAPRNVMDTLSYILWIFGICVSVKHPKHPFHRRTSRLWYGAVGKLVPLV